MAESDEKDAGRVSLDALPLVEIPREVWAKARRPFRGTFFRWSFAITLVLMGLTIGPLAAKVGLVTAGVIAFVGLPLVIDPRLRRIEAEIGTADRAAAAKLLRGLEQRRIVALFAPHAWVAVQKGRLHLTMGDGRAAAKALAEGARILGDVNHPVLVSAQAHALTLSGDRRDARALLAGLEQRNQLTARDHLDLGIAMLEEPGKMRQTIEHLEAAAESLGDHPRVLAALALAYARAEEPVQAKEAWDRAQAGEDVESDPVAADLLKRARKAMRPILEAEDKRGRRAEKRKGSAAPTERQAATPAEGGKRSGKKKKKDRRKERRDKRKASKEKSQPEPARAAKVEAEAKTKPAAKVEPAAKAEPAAHREREAEAKPAAKVEPKPSVGSKPVPPPKPVARIETPRPSTSPQAAPASQPGAPKPPPVVFDGPEGKPIFRPPPLPPPPAVGPPTPSRPLPPKIGAPKVGAPKPPSAPPVSAPKVGPASPKNPAPPPSADDGWGDLLGGDEDAEKK